MSKFANIVNMPPNRTAVLVLIVSLLTTQYVAYRIYTAEKENEKLLVEQEAIYVKTTLEESLNHSITATRMLAYLMENDLVENNFETVSNELTDQNPFIDALQYVVGDTIINTFPIEGHEPTIGYPILEYPSHRKEAMMALDRGDLYFEGPFKLLQGGMGIVGRYPVLNNGELFGFAAVIIRIETVYDVLEIDSTGIKNRFSYQISKRSEADSIQFFNHDEVFDNGLSHTEFVPLGNWDVRVKLRNASHQQSGLLLSGLGILFSALLAFFAGYILREPRRLQVLVDDKTREIEAAREKLEEYNKRLIRSNVELEKFAYVTSHDLQEPLRMVSAFLTQLKRKYGSVLDEKAHSYIHFAVEGADNMRKIILDLLDYSRIGMDGTEREKIDLNGLVQEALALNKKLITEQKAEINVDKLPVINAAKGPVRQLFQNLINNAVKYHKNEGRPKVKITSSENDDFWHFEIKDNGIGIDEEYFDKIFNLFQRLHGKEEYNGSGMGLAICKKIVEELGGKIRVESVLGKGSTFYFSIAKEQRVFEDEN